MRLLFDRGGVLLTANTRAARALHRRHAHQQQAAGLQAWPTPHILDLPAWLDQQWQTLLLTGTEDRLLLNAAQEQALWQRIIAPRLASLSLIAPERMTALAQRAYALLAAHDAFPRLNDASWNSDPLAESEHFRQWARIFRDECHRRRWLPQPLLIYAIADALRTSTLAAPAHLGWLGFDLHTPAERALIAALEAAGCMQQPLAWDFPGGEPQLCTATSDRDEAAACAQWVRGRLAAQPSARIGILAPELSAIRPQLERALLRTLAPDTFSITAEAGAPLFEFAVGLPLGQTPLVRAALLLLHWLEAPLPQQDITWLLLSSTLGTLQDVAAREAAASADARLRNADAASPEIALDSLLRNPAAHSNTLRLLLADLSAMQQTYRRYTRSAPASIWVERIEELLRLAQWGALANLSSLLYQVRQAWASLLEVVASLDFQQQPFTYLDLLAALERIAQETIFAPESTDAPVQAMGAYAAAGQSFDAVWFLSASGGSWPATGRPHPLLPVWLQRELAMPHATPELDSSLAQCVTDRVLHSADAVVFSYAAQGAEGVAQQPSPLVVGMAPLEEPFLIQQVTSIPLEQIEDATWVRHPHPATASGGQYALKRQADCPFQAFAMHRLHVGELPMASRGLSPAVRGNLLHTIMQWVWSRDTSTHPHPHDLASLRQAMTSDTLRPFVATHAAQAFRELQVDRSAPWQRAYLAAEQARLVDLVMDWLHYEARRRDFRIAAVEENLPLHLGELSLHVRADRVDEVAGGHLLIDYKTGEVSPAGWEGPRPEEPQLPLYAAFGDVPDLVGALFAQVRPGDHCFKGRIIGAQSTLMDSLTAQNALVKIPYTPDLLFEWRASLTALAENFVRGEAQVDPREYPKTCRYCTLPGLCRVAESSVVNPSDSDQDEESA